MFLCGFKSVSLGYFTYSLLPKEQVMTKLKKLLSISMTGLLFSLCLVTTSHAQMAEVSQEEMARCIRGEDEACNAILPKIEGRSEQYFVDYLYPLLVEETAKLREEAKRSNDPILQHNLEEAQRLVEKIRGNLQLQKMSTLKTTPRLGADRKIVALLGLGLLLTIPGSISFIIISIKITKKSGYGLGFCAWTFSGLTMASSLWGCYYICTADRTPSFFIILAFVGAWLIFVSLWAWCMEKHCKRIEEKMETP
jgi:hypothetical protein